MLQTDLFSDALTEDQNNWFAVQITDVSIINGIKVYAWQEQQIGINGQFVPCVGGRSGNISLNPLIEYNDSLLLKLPIYAPIRLRGATSGQLLYEFFTSVQLS